MWNATGIRENAAISLDRKLISKWMLKEMDKWAWLGLYWLRIRSSGRIL